MTWGTRETEGKESEVVLKDKTEKRREKGEAEWGEMGRENGRQKMEEKKKRDLGKRREGGRQRQSKRKETEEE